MARIVNIRYKCCGLNFDAAVDCDWFLHCYDETDDEKNSVVPIELYCFDRKDWDIRMVFSKSENTQVSQYREIQRTIFDWDLVMKETRKWVKEMRKRNY